MLSKSYNFITYISVISYVFRFISVFSSPFLFHLHLFQILAPSKQVERNSSTLLVFLIKCPVVVSADSCARNCLGHRSPVVQQLTQKQPIYDLLRCDERRNTKTKFPIRPYAYLAGVDAVIILRRVTTTMLRLMANSFSDMVHAVLATRAAMTFFVKVTRLATSCKK